MSIRWFVVCPTYEAGPYPSEAIAERMRERIAELGACTYEHKIEPRIATQD